MVNHLNIPKDTLRVCKGTSAMHSVRSAFRDEARDEDTGLIAMLRKREITDLYIAGRPWIFLHFSLIYSYEILEVRP